jgi:hypothetical protein
MYMSIEVPEIAEYAKGFPAFWVKTLFVGTVSQNFQVNALASTYVRLVEAALVEYRLGSSKLKEFWDTHESLNLSAMHRCIAHFESCLSDMLRAINCYRRLRRNKDQDPLSLALNAERATFAADAVADQVRNMRNEIHHLDEKLIEGRLQEGQWIALRPDGPERPHPTEAQQTIKSIDRLAIAGRELLFSDLATWLKEMGYVADKIANFNAGAARPPAPNGAA